MSEDDCLIDDGVGATSPVGGRAGFNGRVTAVDQEGRLALLCGTGKPGLSEAFSGIVAAMPGLGRESSVESGFSGRGGNVTRNVSRFCGF